MAKKQTRRSISFSIADYNAAQEAARRGKVPLAQLATTALREHIARTYPAPPPAKFDELIERSSVGRGLANIRENGIATELRDLEEELHEMDDDVPPDDPLPSEDPHMQPDEVRVVYDEERA